MRLFGPCDPVDCHLVGLVEPRHRDCSWFNPKTGETCGCQCHTREQVAGLMSKLVAPEVKDGHK